ncbi:MAG: hypothetical protein HOV97_16630 [Nonomuraea sp.]|nr:hypothetical protein [Nonomuraea sp.]NUS04169.1 hypothetical protein [Nonomuraea sp.]
MDLGPRWPALALALALALGTGATFLPAQAAAAPPALTLAAADDDGDDGGDDDDDDDDDRPPVTRRIPAPKDAGERDTTPKSPADNPDDTASTDDTEGIPGMEARGTGPDDDASRPDDDGRPPVPKGADVRLEETALSSGPHVGPLVLLAILGTGVLVGAASWFSRRFGP